MLPLPLVQEIDGLLKEGKLSQRAIATRLRVSHGTVNAIARGRRTVHSRRQPADARRSFDDTLPRRCRRCGHCVYLPCLICETRVHRERQRVLRLVGELQRR